MVMTTSALAFRIPDKIDRKLLSKYSRAYNNPYHPEDDGFIENISDEDGDNLKYGGKRMGQLSDTERTELVAKRLKINGRYYEIDKGPNSDDDD